MSTAAVLAILVTTGGAQLPEVAALVAAAGEVLGARDAVRLMETPRLSDEEAIRVANGPELRAVVQIAWRDPQRLHVHLRLHATRTDRWIDRDITFGSADTPAERGRALGFALASMLPEGDPSLNVSLESTSTEPSPAARPPPPLGSHAVRAAFLAGAGLGGPAGGLGGALGLETFLTENVSAGVSVAVRTGRLDEPAVRSIASSAAIGATYWPLGWSIERRFGIGVHADALLLHQSVAHTGQDGNTQWKGHLLPGLALKLEGAWRLARSVELVAATGAELALGTVEVTVVSVSPAGGTATIPALRALAEAGVRARF